MIYSVPKKFCFYKLENTFLYKLFLNVDMLATELVWDYSSNSSSSLICAALFMLFEFDEFKNGRLEKTADLV
jgi:hypothetical protein